MHMLIVIVYTLKITVTQKFSATSLEFHIFTLLIYFHFINLPESF